MAAEARDQRILEQLLASLATIGTPAPTVVARGTAKQKAQDTFTIPVTYAGGTLLVAVAYWAAGAGISTVTWNGHTVDYVEDSQIAVGSGRLELYRLAGYAPATADLTVLLDQPGTAVVFAREVLDAQRATDGEVVDQVATGTGTGTVPASGLSPQRDHCYDVLWGVVATNGPVGDNAGSWDAGYTALGRDGTTGDTDESNITLSDAWRLVSAAGREGAGKTNITSRDWAAAALSIRGNWLVGDLLVREGAPGDAIDERPHQVFVEQGPTAARDADTGVTYHEFTATFGIHLLARDLGDAPREIRRLRASVLRALYEGEDDFETLTGYSPRPGTSTPDTDPAPAGYHHGVAMVEFDYREPHDAP